MIANKRKKHIPKGLFGINAKTYVHSYDVVLSGGQYTDCTSGLEQIIQGCSETNLRCVLLLIKFFDAIIINKFKYIF